MPPAGHAPLAERLSTLRAGLSGLGLSRAEMVALVLLVVGGVALGGLLWLRAPSGVPSSAAAAPEPVASGLAVLEASEGASARASPPGQVVVHVTGRVGVPGLVELPAGSRVGEALAAAGGVAGDAAPDALNLARPLVDGEQLHVPAVGETPPPPAAPPAAAEGAPGVVAGGALLPDGRLDLNRATADGLEELPGVGPVTAESILAHREEIGGFSDVGELRDVPGIGEKTFQTLAELVGV